jgi:transposase
MLSFAPNLHIYLHTRPTDLRKSFDGLSGLVRSVFAAEPTDGSLYLFLNRRRDRLKALWWDRDGLALFYKRLARGAFEQLLAADGSDILQLDATQLAMWLGGVTLASAQRRKRYAQAG